MRPIMRALVAGVRSGSHAVGAASLPRMLMNPLLNVALASVTAPQPVENASTLAVAVVAAIGGSLITGAASLGASLVSERGRRFGADREDQRAMRSLRRETFSIYLDRALKLSNVISALGKRSRGDIGPEFDIRAALTDEERVAWDQFNEAGSALPFLLDDQGAKTVDDFETTLIQTAFKEGLGGPVIPWSEQTSEIVEAMRRVIGNR